MRQPQSHAITVTSKLTRSEDMSEQDTLSFKFKRLERLLILMLRDLGVYRLLDWLAMMIERK